LYGDTSFRQRLKKEDKYRFVSFQPNRGVDWTHEREWRVCPDVKLNSRIGLKSEVRLERGKGNQLVPLHFPNLDRDGKWEPELPENPQFVILVESESDKDKITEMITHLQNPSGMPWALIDEIYLPIREYRDKYLMALSGAIVVSLEQARDVRDRRDIWCLEDMLSLPDEAHAQIATLWNKAKTSTRLRVLNLVGAKLDKGYEYCQWQDLTGDSSVFSDTPRKIRERIERDKCAVDMLRDDAKEWAESSFGLGMMD
jgi:hypothetical protein